MSDSTPDLLGFVYGEDVQPESGRSLGYRLLLPSQPTLWSREVESLARRLQAAPYPENWPATDLFCSVLLAEGQRMVALARYGLTDHTPDHRRGGLELIGVIAPAEMDVPSVLAVYRWLKQCSDLTDFSRGWRLAEVLAEQPAAEVVVSPAGAVPILPVRLWQDGAFLFAANNPLDPDQHLSLLDLAGTSRWQWLPLIGADFPLSSYAQRGPLLAWTPHLSGVAIKLDPPIPKKVQVVTSAEAMPGPSWPRWLLAGLLTCLLLGNLWYLNRIDQRLVATHAALEEASKPAPPAPAPSATTQTKDEGSRERFARALYQMLVDKGAQGELQQNRATQLERYDGLLRRYPELRLEPNNEPGKLAVATMAVLAGRNSQTIEEQVRKSLTGKGFSDRLINAAVEHVREQFSEGP